MTNTKTQLTKYILCCTPAAHSINTDLKNRITKLLNKRGEEIGQSNAREEAWQILQEVEPSSRPIWLMQRLTVGTLYIERDRVMGWISENQCQAIPLPLKKTTFYYGERGTGLCNCLEVTTDAQEWKEKGFCKAVNMPLSRCGNRQGDYWIVQFPIEEFFYWLLLGYAMPCPIQWEWNDKGFRVTRSIREFGFWEAWKWWDKAFYFYLEQKPELLGDLDTWLVHRFDPPPNDPFAAVLGDASKAQAENCAKIEPKVKSENRKL